MEKLAPTDHPVHDLVVRRWSPRAFSSQPVPAETLRSLFEAARWAPSSGNGQPWRFLVVTRDQPEAFEAFLGALAPGNASWARAAPVLVFALAHRVRGDTRTPNVHALYDLGQAVAWLSVEATARGLRVHQMAGFDPEEVCARADEIPEDMQVVTAMVIGYPGDPEALPEDLRAREIAPRARLGQAELVFGPRWGVPWSPEGSSAPGLADNG